MLWLLLFRILVPNRCGCPAPNAKTGARGREVKEKEKDPDPKEKTASRVNYGTELIR